MRNFSYRWQFWFPVKESGLLPAHTSALSCTQAVQLRGLHPTHVHSQVGCYNHSWVKMTTLFRQSLFLEFSDIFKNPVICNYVQLCESSVADPESGAYLPQGSGIRIRDDFFPDPGSRIPHPGSLPRPKFNISSKLCKKWIKLMQTDIQLFHNKNKC
jgi:hypothetical protein